MDYEASKILYDILSIMLEIKEQQNEKMDCIIELLESMDTRLCNKLEVEVTIPDALYERKD